MSYETKVDGYVTPTPEQTAARKKRNYAIGGSLLAFCAFIFILMLVKLQAGDI